MHPFTLFSTCLLRTIAVVTAHVRGIAAVGYRSWYEGGTAKARGNPRVTLYVLDQNKYPQAVHLLTF